MPSSQTASEGGLRNHRTEFVRETVTADGEQVPPADPNWQLYSDTVRAFEWSPDPGMDAQHGIGDADPNNHFRGPEEHSLSVTYDLQRWLVDGAGDPVDAAADGIMRNDDNLLPNTHTVVDRERKAAITAGNTLEGDARRDTRIYTVGIGGHVDEVTLTGDPGDQQPVAVELSYEFVHMRTYQVDQPDAPVALEVVSTDAADNTQSIVLEGEGGAPSMTLALNGTTAVSTGATTFDNIDAAYIVDANGNPTDTVGNVQIRGGTGGPLLAEIQGAAEYDDIEGDFGIPPTGAGSHAAPVGTAYEKFIGDTVTRGGGRLAMDINSFEFTVGNNTERTVRHDSFGQRVHVGTRDSSVSASVVGETESHDSLVSSLVNEGADIVWTLSGGTLTLVNSRLTDPGDRSIESEQAVLTLDNEFSGEGIAIDAGAV